MEFSIVDPNVNGTMNAFLILANVLNLVYNLPQVLQTYRTKSTGDINQWFIGLRVVGNCIWIAYAVYINSFFLLLNNVVTVLSSVFIGYYKYVERAATEKPRGSGNVARGQGAQPRA